MSKQLIVFGLRTCRAPFPIRQAGGVRTRDICGEGESVTSCVDMKVGQVYVCPECRVALQVVKACGESDHPSWGPQQCKLMCCYQEMQLKS